MRNFSLVLITFIVVAASPSWAEETENALVGKIVAIDKERNTLTISTVGEDDSKQLTLSEQVSWSKDLKIGSVIRVWGSESTGLFVVQKLDVLKTPGKLLHDSTGVRRRLRRGLESGRGGHGRH
jgi:hypothetical protein